VRIDKPTNVEVLTIYDADGLDPITVLLQDFGGGNGRVIVECYCQAWAAWWGAMGPVSLRAFLLGCDPGYIVSRMGAKVREEKYLTRIVKAMQAALRTETPSQGTER
jgi:hypothetical protein